jgi:hypothetical protein
MRERGLLYGQKWADFVATRTYYADGPSDNQEKQIPRNSKSETRSRHQNGADDQHPAPPYAIRSCGEVQRNDRIAEQRQGKEQAGLGFVETQANEVEN